MYHGEEDHCIWFICQSINISLIARFMGPIWCREDPCWPHELCYLGSVCLPVFLCTRSVRTLMCALFSQLTTLVLWFVVLPTMPLHKRAVDNMCSFVIRIVMTNLGSCIYMGTSTWRAVMVYVMCHIFCIHVMVNWGSLRADWYLAWVVSNKCHLLSFSK